MRRRRPGGLAARSPLPPFSSPVPLPGLPHAGGLASPRSLSVARGSPLPHLPFPLPAHRLPRLPPIAIVAGGGGGGAAMSSSGRSPLPTVNERDAEQVGSTTGRASVRGRRRGGGGV